MNFQYRRPDVVWTEEKKAQLKSFWGTSMTYEEMGKALADEHGPLSPGSVQRQLLRQGLVSDPNRVRYALGRNRWDQQRLDFVREKWLIGFTASEIARELGDGITRNAVIGKVNRMGLQRNKEVALKNARGVNKPSAGRSRSPRAPAYSVLRQPKKVVPPRALPPPPPADDRVGVSLMDLKNNSCRAIIGHGSDTLARYCGLVCDQGKSFCPGHQAIYYQPYEKRR